MREALEYNFLAKLIAWGLLSALSFHFVAGVRHLVMHFDIGLDLEGGVQTSKITFIAAAVLVILAGVWVW